MREFGRRPTLGELQRTTPWVWLCRETGLTFWIVRRPVHEYADAPRLLDLLCARKGYLDPDRRGERADECDAVEAFLAESLAKPR